jgi:hypothetical protein
MDNNKIKKFLEWYGYENPHFETTVGNRHYFRCDDWFVFVIVGENSLEVYQAREDFCEHYPIDSDVYDFEFEAEFSKEEIEHEMN